MTTVGGPRFTVYGPKRLPVRNSAQVYRVVANQTPVLTSIVVSPASASVSVGQSQSYSAAGFDQFGNPMAATFSWSVSGGGTIDSQGVFSATTVGGPFTVTAQSGALSATAQVTVTAVPVLTSIVVSPASASVSVGQSQSYSAAGFDQFGNPMAATFSWSVSGGGTIDSQGVFSATTVGGPFTVTAQSGALSATAQVTVTAVPVLTSIVVSPASASVSVGQSQSFSAAGFDQFGNPMAATFSWSVSGGGTIDSQGVFSATTVGGPFTVTAQSGALSATAQVTVTTSTVTNVALGKTAVASSVEASGFEAANVVDGSSSTRWSSTFNDAEWIYVDLEGLYTINRVVLNWETAFGSQYQIQVSNDAVTWNTVFTESAGNGATDDISLQSTDARYVRMNGVNRATVYGYSLWEFEVYGVVANQTPVLTSIVVSPASANVSVGQSQSYSAAGFDQFGNPMAATFSWSVSGGGTIDSQGVFSATTVGGPFTVTAQSGALSATAQVTVTTSTVTNVALGKTAVASSVEASGFEAANVVDGSSSTRWSSTFNDAEWIYVDLEGLYTINRVVLNWETAFGSQYQIQVSNDAVTWNTVFTESAGNGATDDISLQSTDARYVRMNGVNRATAYGYSLWEFEVYGVVAN